MQGALHPGEIDLAPFSDPAKLALLGTMVCGRLCAIPGITRIDTGLADIFVLDGFMTRRDCKAIAEVINTRAVPSPLYRGTEREGFRTSFTHHFERTDPLTRDIEDYLSEITGIDRMHGEVIQGQRYAAGQQFKAHHDFFSLGESYWSHEALRGGQRTWTAMVYLNEPREGGETEFPLLGITLKPRAGSLVLWNNMDRTGRPNARTLHAGKPVQRGIKHVITQWYRQEPWRLLNPGDYPAV